MVLLEHLRGNDTVVARTAHTNGDNAAAHDGMTLYEGDLDNVDNTKARRQTRHRMYEDTRPTIAMCHPL